MFSEGLDRNALRWVREGARTDPVHGLRTGCRSFVVPPTDKFRSGHLPSRVIPVTHPVSGDADESGSASDMDETTDTEDEVYGGRYSLDSSPQDERTPNGSANKFKVPLSRLQQNYSSATMSSDSNSLRETARRQQTHLTEDRNVVAGGRYQIGQSYYSESEMSDSAGSTEFSSRVGGKNVCMQSKGSYTEEGYSSSAAPRVASRFATEKESYRRDMQSKNHSGLDIPSAPPFHGPSQDIKQELDQNATSRGNCNPASADLDDSSVKNEASTSRGAFSGDVRVNGSNSLPEKCIRDNSAGAETAGTSGSLPDRLPTFHASGQGPWHAVIAYDACVRLCLHSWARGLMEAPVFLENECALLRNAFGLQHVLLQSEEELLEKRSSELVSESATAKPKKTIGKMKVQVRKIKMSPDMPNGCSFSSLKPSTMRLNSLRTRISNLQSAFSSGWEALKKVRVMPRTPANSSFSRHSLAYVNASAQYIKQVSALLKIGVTTLRSSSSYDVVQEVYTCHLRLKSLPAEDEVRMQPGSGETHVFFPDSLGDDLIVEIHDSKGISCGRVLAQVASVAEDPGDKLRWWPIYHEPEHELVGRLHLYINYATCLDENSSLKCGSVAETVAYDFVLEVAMKVQHFRQRNLILHGNWKWLLTEFASYYGVSDAYTKLRYLSYVMDVATPTADCLMLVYDLLSPVILQGRGKTTLSHQENRILGEIEDQIDQVLALTFENYKSLDESLPSGMMDTFRPATGSPAPALGPAIKLYSLLHDVLSPEAQLKLCKYFQSAAKKRARRYLMETDEYVATNSEGTLTDVVTLKTAYQKMQMLCLNLRNEVYTDIEINDKHVLPSFIDLPNISASIYSVELCNRLRSFLVACPPTSPSPPVADLVIVTADFQRDLDRWNICPVKGGVDAKELFHLYIVLWIEDKRISLLESCKLDKVRWAGVRTQHSTTPFVDGMYNRLKETLNEYEVITRRWPEYTFGLENAVADIEKAVLEALDKQYADVLLPLKDALTPKKFGLKYVQKLAMRNSMGTYIVPEELGVLLNTMKRLLDVLRPTIELQLKEWGSCMPGGGSSATGDRLSEVTVLLRAKFKNHVQAVVEKLAKNTRLQGATKIKKIIQDSKENVTDSDVRSRMQPLKEQLTQTIDHLHTVFESHVFVAVCRGFWDRMGQDVLRFLENKKESRSWYKSSRIAVAILDDTFASQMQQLLGNGFQEKDVEPPRSIMEVRSMLCKDAPNHRDSNYYY